MTYPKLHFNYPFEEIEWDVKMKGWFSGLTVELEGGKFYEVNFYDLGRLSQDLAAQVENIGKGWDADPYMADVGMIVLPEMTEANIREAIQKLYEAK